jgi:tripartite-type tricarboxylate transporter receptor subunit TctC
MPGNPQIVVQNMPGAASLKAVQYLDSGAPQDGSVVAAFNSGLLSESLLNSERFRFKFSEVAWLGSINRDLRACYAWAETGIQSFADLKKRAQFNMGAAAPGTASFANAAVLKNMLGVAVHMVTGYRGSGELRIAIQRGEVDGDCGTWSSLPADWTSNKKINALVRFSPMPVPGVAADVPFVGDLLKSEADRSVLNMLLSPDQLGRPYVVSRSIPPDRLDALRAAFDAMMNDPEFLTDAEKSGLPVVAPIASERASAIVAELYNTPAALVARARAIMAK